MPRTFTTQQILSAIGRREDWSFHDRRSVRALSALYWNGLSKLTASLMLRICINHCSCFCSCWDVSIDDIIHDSCFSHGYHPVCTLTLFYRFSRKYCQFLKALLSLPKEIEFFRCLKVVFLRIYDYDIKCSHLWSLKDISNMKHTHIGEYLHEFRAR
ncbi:unnamed protein product [Albugo candida]|uniref:Uncharacterized protein n=1 Tax=Albugo candida TaxID=65357 RepID=A0A024GHE3_9STRA|nr:unnamed protein product [Albugo candida]|eukprot:CCI45772.1 unnamed protein product [Albugo candida]